MRWVDIIGVDVIGFFFCCWSCVWCVGYKNFGVLEWCYRVIIFLFFVWFGWSNCDFYFRVWVVFFLFWFWYIFLFCGFIVRIWVKFVVSFGFFVIWYVNIRIGFFFCDFLWCDFGFEVVYYFCCFVFVGFFLGFNFEDCFLRFE